MEQNKSLTEKSMLLASTLVLALGAVATGVESASRTMIPIVGYEPQEKPQPKYNPAHNGYKILPPKKLGNYQHLYR